MTITTPTSILDQLDDLFANIKTTDDPRVVARGCRHIRSAGRSARDNQINAIKILARCGRNGKQEEAICIVLGKKFYLYNRTTIINIMQEPHIELYCPRCTTFEQAETAGDKGWCRSCQYYGQLFSPLQCPEHTATTDAC